MSGWLLLTASCAGVVAAQDSLPAVVTIACIDVMEAKARLALANDNLRSLDGIVRLNQVRLDSGAIAPVELTRSRVAMLQFRANVTTAELGLATSRTKLHTLLGRRGN